MKLRTLLLMATKQAGCYDPDEVLPHIEESLTPSEFTFCQDFLTWIKINGLTFGHGNIDDRIREYKLSPAAGQKRRVK
jgi:hypothetical protein